MSAQPEPAPTRHGRGRPCRDPKGWKSDGIISFRVSRHQMEHIAALALPSEQSPHMTARRIVLKFIPDNA